MLAGLAAMPGAASAQTSDPIGVTSAVNPDARGVRPDGAQNVLLVGSNVIFKERIETGPGGQAQLLFNDQSAISVGPNATLVIDQFVYNPTTGTGQMAVSLARGTMRFVGGKISKQNEVTIATPAATIGIRGGVTMPTVADDGSTRVVHIFGATTVRTPNGESTTLTRPGFVAEIAAPALASAPASAPTAGTQAPSASAAPPPGGGIAVRRASEAEISSTKSQLEAAPARQTTSALAAPAAAPNQQAAAPQGQGQSQAQGPTQGPPPGQPANNAGGAPPPPPAGGRIDGALGGSGFTGQNSGVAPNQIVTVGNTQPGFGGGPPPPGQQAAQAGAQANTTGAAQTGTITNVQQNFQSFTSSLTFLGRARYGNWSVGPGTGLAAPVFDAADKSRPFSATIANGRFSGTLNNGETFGFNVPSDPLGRAVSTGFGGTSSPGGQFSGTTTFSADGRFFYGYYQFGNGERLATFGGAAVSGAALADSSARVVREYVLSIDPALSGNIPFAPGMESGSNFANPSVGKFTTVTPAAGGQPGRALQVSFALDGSGSTQRSLLSVGTFNIANDSAGNLTVSGGTRGIYDLAGTQRPGRFGASVTSETDANGNSFFGSLATGNAPSYFVLGQNDLNASNTRTTSDAFRSLVNNGAASDQYYRFSNNFQTRDGRAADDSFGRGHEFRGAGRRHRQLRFHHLRSQRRARDADRREKLGGARDDQSRCWFGCKRRLEFQCSPGYVQPYQQPCVRDGRGLARALGDGAVDGNRVGRALRRLFEFQLCRFPEHAMGLLGWRRRVPRSAGDWRAYRSLFAGNVGCGRVADHRRHPGQRNCNLYGPRHRHGQQ
jgi:hypothetical protein